MPLFDIPERVSRTRDKTIASKSKKKAPATIKGGGGLLGRINEIQALVEKNLGKYRDEYLCIQDTDILHDYMQDCIGNQYISIDTETTGLDPLQDMLVGVCINTYNEKPAYIPLNHVSYVTGIQVQGQLPINEIRREFARLLSIKPDIDMFNACFDIRVLRANGVEDIYCTHDGYLAARLLNENEPESNLKMLHKKYVLKGQEDAFTFSDLFRGITFDKVPINCAYLYGAHDGIITTELCDYQRQFIYYDRTSTPEDRNGMNGVSWVFKYIEMPCIQPVSIMEDNGVEFDFDKQRELSIKYNALLKEKEQAFYDSCEPYKKQIEQYRKKGTSKLDNPINIGSPVQIAILLYDIIKVGVIEPKKPRGTGEEILAKIDSPIAKAILEYREMEKSVSTYIDKLPGCVNPKDGRIHCKFNQYGAKTGRMSSSDPNLQNIPSHNKDIRQMFKASDGYVLMSSDFSQQEPKCLAAMCRQAGDSQMYDTFMQGKDLYSEIASKAFNKSYEECLEFNTDGSTNKEGKERRTQAKSILLGVLYGRGEASIAEQLNVSASKAKSIKESVFIGFPAIREFEQASLDMAYELGYVTTVCGRKRRLPDLQLPEYEFKWKDGAPPDDDLLDFDSDTVNAPTDVPEDKINYYSRKLHKAWGKEKSKIFAEAKEEGIQIIDNGGKIADAERQCVNSRIQGSAADLTKLAMIQLADNEELKKLGFRLLIPVHDEIIAECPKEYAKECSMLLAKVMSQAAEKILEMPIKCDVVLTDCWYGKEIKIDGI